MLQLRVTIKLFHFQKLKTKYDSIEFDEVLANDDKDLDHDHVGEKKKNEEERKENNTDKDEATVSNHNIPLSTTLTRLIQWD